MSLPISEAAFDLIVREEDSDEAYYTRHYQHFEWPQGASGPTIGIGYDCGYVTPGEARLDWAGVVSDGTIEAIVRACGLKGAEAAQFVRLHRSSVTVTWEQAISEFRNREVPKWANRVTAALPNCELLSPDSFGALVSLSYNRGTGGFNDPHNARFAEMREIRRMMQAKQFDHIAGEFLSMRRLWPRGGDLWNRRGHEASLFAQGLVSPGVKPAPAAPPSAVATAPPPASGAWASIKKVFT